MLSVPSAETNSASTGKPVGVMWCGVAEAACITPENDYACRARYAWLSSAAPGHQRIGRLLYRRLFTGILIADIDRNNKNLTYPARRNNTLSTDPV